MDLRTTENRRLENRVLVLMPTGRDARLVCATLEKARIEAQVCLNAQEIEGNLPMGAGAILIAEEALQNGTLEHLIETFRCQPVWSDIPVVIFASNALNSEKLIEAVGTRFNVMVVERPIRIAMLVSAVRGALRARQRQYEARNLLNQLEQADHQKDLFLATLSHELRTPLNSIIGWIKMLRTNAKSMDLSRGLEVIERNAKAQEEIISDILFVSRIITGKLTLKLRPMDFIPVVQEAMEVVLPLIEAKKIKLNAFFDSNIKQIKGDPERLKQVFLNILSNAIKFTPRHGRIDIQAFLNGGQVEIEISDSGQGIKPEFLPFIFERFRQADNSYTRQVGGLGLGLAIVWHLVEIHGGNVSVKSEGLNQGTTFTIQFPILNSQQLSSAADETLAQSPETNDSKEQLKGISILLVEDNKDSREMLKTFFDQFEMKITAVDSAAEALSVIEQIRPDILISDIGMPGQDGYQLIRKIRELTPENGGNIPAIALTGYASLQDREDALRAGYQEHIPKPIDVDKLLELVKELLDKKTAIQICG
jgi:signal transduction histidine kinase/CheY-like chemotaxis protein